MADERVWLLIVCALGGGGAVWTWWRRARSRPPGSAAPARPAPSRTVKAQQPAQLHRVAIGTLVASASAAVLFVWAGAFRQLGAAGWVPLLLFFVPVAFGFVHQALRRAPNGSED